MSRPKPSIRITDAEWEVLVVAWAAPPVSANDVRQALGSTRNWSSGTVRTLLARLVQKGALRAEKSGRRFLYWPLVSKEECARQESRSLIDKVFGGAPSSMILNLVEETELSQDDIRKLRRILRDKARDDKKT